VSIRRVEQDPLHLAVIEPFDDGLEFFIRSPRS
jgi:hypothetical protein